MDDFGGGGGGGGGRRFRGGGSAGGKRGPKGGVQYVKHVPKFLQAYYDQQKAVEDEQEQELHVKAKHADDAGYDHHNATVVNEEELDEGDLLGLKIRHTHRDDRGLKTMDVSDLEAQGKFVFKKPEPKAKNAQAASLARQLGGDRGGGDPGEREKERDRPGPLSRSPFASGARSSQRDRGEEEGGLRGRPDESRSNGGSRGDGRGLRGRDERERERGGWGGRRERSWSRDRDRDRRRERSSSREGRRYSGRDRSRSRSRGRGGEGRRETERFGQGMRAWGGDEEKERRRDRGRDSAAEYRRDERDRDRRRERSASRERYRGRDTQREKERGGRSPDYAPYERTRREDKAPPLEREEAPPHRTGEDSHLTEDPYDPPAPALEEGGMSPPGEGTGGEEDLGVMTEEEMRIDDLCRFIDEDRMEGRREEEERRKRQEREAERAQERERERHREEARLPENNRRPGTTVAERGRAREHPQGVQMSSTTAKTKKGALKLSFGDEEDG